jgi:hypothetical protein
MIFSGFEDLFCCQIISLQTLVVEKSRHISCKQWLDKGASSVGRLIDKVGITTTPLVFGVHVSPMSCCEAASASYGWLAFPLVKNESWWLKERFNLQDFDKTFCIPSFA